MVRILCRKILKMQKNDITFSKLNEYYSNENNQSHIFLIYENETLMTLISYKDFQSIRNDNYFNFYLLNSNNCHIEHDLKQADEIFQKNPLWNYIITDIFSTEGTFLCRTDMNDIYKEIYSILMRHNVNIFRIRIPNTDEIIKRNRSDLKCHLTFSQYIDYIERGDLNAPWYISHITDIEPDDLKKPTLLQNQNLEIQQKTIFLVGPCLVGGWENPEGERLGELLMTRIIELELGYQIKYVPFAIFESSNWRKILENDIKHNDIVLLIYNGLSEYEFDMTHIFNSYCGNKWLYQDSTLHTTVTGNKLIAHFLLNKIILPIYNKSNPVDNSEIIYYGEPQFTQAVLNQIQLYINQIKLVRALPDTTERGAIVMNCNPFTYGHRFLVEYASKQVDYLYVFVVEEDLSAIPFSDRLLMVYEGIKDIPNIILIPSGRFIISQDTFKNYFEKESDIHDANAEEDVYIFARYIAKYLHITKRFVGQEPIDHITNIYNQTMKRILPNYGIDVIEIPRKELDNGNIINASSVRKLLLNEKWDEIRKYAPETTVNYLQRIGSILKYRTNYNKKKSTDYLQKQTQNIIHTICSKENNILYSIGHNTEILLKLVPPEIAEKLEFCDKSAIDKTIYFHGKQVATPQQLLTIYNDYNIIVTSPLYNAEIYQELIELKISMDRCYFVTIILDPEIQLYK